MVTYLLRKSYQLKDLKETEFQDLWGDHGVFTTMWIYGSSPKILFFNEHIQNLLKSIKKYKIFKSSMKKDINRLIKNMYLQIDATVLFAITDGKYNLGRKLLFNDFIS